MSMKMEFIPLMEVSTEIQYHLQHEDLVLHSIDFCATNISFLRSEDQKYLSLFKKFSIY